MIEDKLLKKGYTKYKPSAIDNECVTALFQKRFDDNTGKKYFINVKRWDFSRYNCHRDILNPSYEYEVQLYEKDTHNAVDILFHSCWDIENVEKMVEEMFQSEKFDYYEEW